MLNMSSSEFDPQLIASIACCSSEAASSPYPSSGLSRYDVFSSAWGRTCSDASSLRGGVADYGARATAGTHATCRRACWIGIERR